MIYKALPRSMPLRVTGPSRSCKLKGQYDASAYLMPASLAHTTLETSEECKVMIPDVNDTEDAQRQVVDIVSYAR